MNLINKFFFKLGIINNSPLRKTKKNNFVFIHINKTGGTSIIKAIGLPQKKHLTVREVIDIIGKTKWENAYKFTVVRNPWSKVVSHYNYRVKTNQTKMGEETISFTKWVKFTYGIKKNDYYYDNPKMFQQQIDWLKDFEDKINIDKVIRFENLNDGFCEVANLLGISTHLPHLNRTKKFDYKNYYNQSTKQIIADWFKDDINYFGYEFN